MKMFRFLGTSALGSAAFLGASAIAATPALAQNADGSPCTPAQREAGTCTDQTSANNAADTSIVVTGTRIRRPTLEAPVPITSIAQAELPNQGQNNLGDSLNDLPSLRSTFSQQNSGRFIGTAGENFLDLRGLGTSRTLVLVNGRRHVTSSAGDFTVDVNTIPVDLLERVDVVTGGQSAVYGSDAIAGVVNFVLMRNFDGVRVRGQGGVSTYGDRGNYFASLTAGHNFADGRANIAVALEYAHAEPVYVADRRHFRNSCGFDQVEDTTAENGTPTNSDGIPDNDFVCHIAVPGITEGGAIGALGNGSTLGFDPTGRLGLTAPDRLLESGDVLTQNPLAGTPLNERDQLAVGQDRYTINLLAHFDVSNAFQPFLEAKFVHQRVLQEGQPTFVQGRFNGFFAGNFGNPNVPSLRCNNPFLQAQALAELQSFGICTNVATGTFGLNRFNVDFGGRAETDTRETYRIVGGIQGNFNDDWHYELSVNYGHFRSNVAAENNLLFGPPGTPEGFALAVDAVRNAAGQIVCRVNADADPANDAPGCVPINLFGYGAPSQAALDYVNTTSHIFSSASELDILGYVSGDLSQLFSLPGGPIGFSVGAEYRRERAQQHADPVSASGATFFNAFQPFNPPTFDVKEIFGEVNVPLLRDLPFVRELTVSAAARYSDYNTPSDKTFAWNLNAIWAPVRDIRFRANYSRSVRVPTLSDLYATPSQDFAFLDDPCDASNIGTGNHRANCAALGIPATTPAGSPCIGQLAPNGTPIAAGQPFINCVTNGGGVRTSIGFVDAGNPHLQEEVGKSLTIGAVITPRFLPGFSLTVDYFDIKVTNLIAVLGAQTILSQCVDQPNINNQFCALLNPRDAFGLFTTPALIASGVNFARQTSRGIDADLAYRRSLGGGVRLNLRGLATYTLERNNFTDPTNATTVDRQLSELGDPVFSGSLIAGLEYRQFTLQWTTRYIGGMNIFSYETIHSQNGNPPTNPDIATHFYYPAVWYHDARFETRINDRYRMYVGVDNVFNRLPPFGLTGTGAGGAIYTNVGRFFYAGAQVDF